MKKSRIRGVSGNTEAPQSRKSDRVAPDDYAGGNAAWNATAFTLPRIAFGVRSWTSVERPVAPKRLSRAIETFYLRALGAPARKTR